MINYHRIKCPHCGWQGPLRLTNLTEATGDRYCPRCAVRIEDNGGFLNPAKKETK